LEQISQDSKPVTHLAGMSLPPTQASSAPHASPSSAQLVTLWHELMNEPHFQPRSAHVSPLHCAAPPIEIETFPPVPRLPPLAPPVAVLPPPTPPEVAVPELPPVPDEGVTIGPLLLQAASQTGNKIEPIRHGPCTALIIGLNVVYWYLQFKPRRLVSLERNASTPV
jgi:hypothetical protein